jgi:hypothetical protein
MANIVKQTRINAFNESEGYSKRLNLLNPIEVIYEKRLHSSRFSNGMP